MPGNAHETNSTTRVQPTLTPLQQPLHLTRLHRRNHSHTQPPNSTRQSHLQLLDQRRNRPIRTRPRTRLPGNSQPKQRRLYLLAGATICSLGALRPHQALQSRAVVARSTRHGAMVELLACRCGDFSDCHIRIDPVRDGDYSGVSWVMTGSLCWYTERGCYH